MTAVDTPIVALLQRHKDAHGLTWDEVADELGVHRQTVFSWLSGRTEPDPERAEAIEHLTGACARCGHRLQKRSRK